jgi:predicted  nucleic acid-binding Zn-ribbon protein
MQQRNYRPWFVITLVFTLIGIITSVTFYSQLSTTQNSLTLTESQLSADQTELATAQNNLDTTQNQLSTTQNQLASTQSSLVSTQGQLTSTQGQLTTAQSQLTTAQINLIATQNSLVAAQSQEASLQTSLSAAASQVSDLQSQLLSSNILADPTYASMQSFIASDKTNQNIYNANTYNCVNFSADVIANAAKQHIRCAFINIDFPGTTGHAIVGFNTTDKGMVYIEPQSDGIVNLKVGGRYYQEEVPPSGYYYVAPSYDDTVARFVAVW